MCMIYPASMYSPGSGEGGGGGGGCGLHPVTLFPSQLFLNFFLSPSKVLSIVVIALSTRS